MASGFLCRWKFQRESLKVSVRFLLKKDEFIISKGVKLKAQNILSHRASITQRADPPFAHDDPSAAFMAN